MQAGCFFILGVSGSGKGTLVKHLLESGCTTKARSMGDILRLRQHDTHLEAELGGDIPSGFVSRTKYLQYAVQTGLLIPDAWTQSIVEAELEQIPPNILWAFDGYPRSPAAAQHLLLALEQRQIPCLGVVHLKLEFEAMQRRLLARGRIDDTLDGIANRYRFYTDSVIPTLSYLRGKTRVLELDANLESDVLAEAVKQWLT